jgi:hypothetical protein
VSIPAHAAAPHDVGESGLKNSWVAWPIALELSFAERAREVPHRLRLGCESGNRTQNFGNSDTLTIYRDTLTSEATKGRYKEATHCITTTKATAIEPRGNSAPDRALVAKVEALSGPSPAVSNRHGADRSVLGDSAGDVGLEAELVGATFAPPSSRCSQSVRCTATRSFKSSPSARTVSGR